MTPAIRVENLGKRYRVVQGGPRAAYRTLRETLAGVATAPLRTLRGRTAEQRAAEEFWALKDVSFEVQPGEVVGIIGRNGAGKSTLLKILSRITKPTTGRVELNGRVGSLLEVGTGFHPELTGRENVYLNGSILGMSRREIAAKFDEIVAFAEVEKFLDTPVKRYSSGMYVRLAFAVAAHLEPEILIVDEVLAVGDAGFQERCLGKIQEIGRAGRTVFFVSHHLASVAKLTTRAVYMKQGQIEADGQSVHVVHKYISRDGKLSSEWQRNDGAPRRQMSITKVRCLDITGEPSTALRSDRPFYIEISVDCLAATQAQLAFRLNHNASAETVFTTALSDTTGQVTTSFSAGPSTSRCEIPAHLLPPGQYHLLLALNTLYGPQYDLVEKALTFEITEVGSLKHLDGRLGEVFPLLAWTWANAEG